MAYFRYLILALFLALYYALESLLNLVGLSISESMEAATGVGDTVRLYRGPFGLRYYDPTSYVGTALGFLVAAVIVLIGGFRGIRVSSRKEPST